VLELHCRHFREDDVRCFCWYGVTWAFWAGSAGASSLGRFAFTLGLLPTLLHAALYGTVPGRMFGWTAFRGSVVAHATHLLPCTYSAGEAWRKDSCPAWRNGRREERGWQTSLGAHTSLYGELHLMEHVRCLYHCMWVVSMRLALGVASSILSSFFDKRRRL